MKQLLIVLFALLVTGCATTCEPELQTVTKLERIVVKPPIELLTIPPYNMPIDVDFATQRSVADWILQSERRTEQLEDQLKAIKKFYDENN